MAFKRAYFAKRVQTVDTVCFFSLFAARNEKAYIHEISVVLMVIVITLESQLASLAQKSARKYVKYAFQFLKKIQKLSF